MPGQVLIVDDLATSVKVLAAKLTSEYYDVMPAHDGAQVLDIIRSTEPDLVLLDVMMPGMDGFEVCRQIKSDPATRHVPVILLTALNGVRDRVNGLTAGSDDFLSKPVNDTMLFARADSLIRIKRVVDQIKLHQETLRSFGMAADLDWSADGAAGGRVTVVDTSDIYGGNLKKTIEDEGHEVTLLTGAEETAARIAEDPGDLAVLNLDYEGRGPLGVVSMLRSNQATRHPR
ncbi:MAG: response regulator [Rhodospirillaceae bacterium]